MHIPLSLHFCFFLTTIGKIYKGNKSKIELSMPLLARQWEEDKPQEGDNEDT